MPMIHRVRLLRILPDLSTQQVFAFRMAGDQIKDAEAFGNRLQTRWMEENPGHATVLITDWPTQEELGDEARDAWSSRTRELALGRPAGPARPV